MRQSQTVAITGAAGYLGSLTRQHLGRDFMLRSLDIAALGAPAAGEICMNGSVADFDAVAQLLEGCDLVVHLAASLATDDWSSIEQANVRGTYNVYEASRQHGIRRVLFASSHHVAGMYPTDQVIDSAAVFRPDSLYGASKCFGESLAQMYYDKHGIETVSMRIGSARPKPTEPRERYTWLSEPDYLRLLDASIACPVVGYTAVWGISNNDGHWWTNHNAGHLGFAPKDNASTHMGPATPVAGQELELLKFHGGKRAIHGLKSARAER